MKAIVTKYLPATGIRGSRIKATAEGVGSVFIDYPHEFSGAATHAQAALKLCRKFGWTGELVSGGMPDSSGYVFCFTEADRFAIAPEVAGR